MFGSSRLEQQLRETRDIAVRAETKADSHVVACIEHNKRVEDMLAALREERNKQHAEGQAGNELLHGRISKLGARMNVMVIGGLGTTVLALFGALYAIFSHKLGLTG